MRSEIVYVRRIDIDVPEIAIESQHLYFDISDGITASAVIFRTSPESGGTNNRKK